MPLTLKHLRSCRSALIAAIVCGIAASLSAEEVSQAVATSMKSEITLASAIAPANVGVTGPITLAYKFQPGQFIHYVGSNKVLYSTELGDQYNISKEHRNPTNLQSNVTKTHFRVVTVDEQGNALVEPMVDHTRMTARMHGKPPVEFDSATNVNPSPEFQSIRDVIGRRIARFQVAPTGKLLKAIIIDSTAPQALLTAAEKLETRFPCLSPMPANPVSVGDKWRDDYSIFAMNHGLKEPMPLRRIFELTSVIDGVATIKFKTIVMVPVSDTEIEKQLAQQTPSGVIEFDVERGLVRSYTSTVNRTIMNAFGAQSLLRVAGEATERLDSIQ